MSTENNVHIKNGQVISTQLLLIHRNKFSPFELPYFEN